MRSALKLLHRIGMAGFVGSLGVRLTLAAYGAKSDASAVAFMRTGVAYGVRHVTFPSLWIILATGLVLTALQKELAAWVYAKIAVGVVVLFVALFIFLPTSQSGVGLALLGLAFVAAALGIFRPTGKGSSSASKE